jgi:hypothetical protein
MLTVLNFPPFYLVADCGTACGGQVRLCHAGFVIRDPRLLLCGEIPPPPEKRLRRDDAAGMTPTRVGELAASALGCLAAQLKQVAFFRPLRGFFSAPS